MEYPTDGTLPISPVVLTRLMNATPLFQRLCRKEDSIRYEAWLISQTEFMAVTG
jgi:hypothetical protein